MSTDCFLLGPTFAPCFCTRNPAVAGLGGLGGVEAVVEAVVDDGSFAGWSSTAAVSGGPQWHFCLLGIAAVTAAHAHGREDGCGHELNGRPGFRTGTMSRSLACVHLVERWPRMQGSQAIFCPLIRGMMRVVGLENCTEANPEGDDTETSRLLRVP